MQGKGFIIIVENEKIIRPETKGRESSPFNIMQHLFWKLFLIT